MSDERPAGATPKPPGEYIREALTARGWTQADLARILGRPLPMTIVKVVDLKDGTADLRFRYLPGGSVALRFGTPMHRNLVVPVKDAEGIRPPVVIKVEATIKGAGLAQTKDEQGRDEFHIEFLPEMRLLR